MENPIDIIDAVAKSLIAGMPLDSDEQEITVDAIWLHSRAGRLADAVFLIREQMAGKAALLEACRTAIEHFNKSDATHDCTGRPVDCSMVRDVVRAAIALATRQQEPEQ